MKPTLSDEGEAWNCFSATIEFDQCSSVSAVRENVNAFLKEAHLQVTRVPYLGQAWGTILLSLILLVCPLFIPFLRNVCPEPVNYRNRVFGSL